MDDRPIASAIARNGENAFIGGQLSTREESARRGRVERETSTQFHCNQPCRGSIAALQRFRVSGHAESTPAISCRIYRTMTIVPAATSQVQIRPSRSILSRLFLHHVQHA